MIFKCENCGSQLEVPEGMAGENVVCPVCNKEIVVSGAVNVSPSDGEVADSCAAADNETQKNDRTVPIQPKASRRRGCILFAFLIVLLGICGGGWGVWQFVPKSTQGAIRRSLFGIKNFNDLQTEFNLVRCPGGQIDMVDNHYWKEQDFNEAMPRDTPIPAEFWLGKYEVTQKEWKTVMGGEGEKGKENYPVENVSWDEAMKYCRLLTEKYVSVLPEGYSFCLPTEAQWQYACQSGQSSTVSADSDTAWYEANIALRPQPVGGKMANAWGFCDMLGNVAEWCLDYCVDYDAFLYDASLGYCGGMLGKTRVIRGGSCKEPARKCTSDSRQDMKQEGKLSTVGFRVALIKIPLSSLPK